MARAPHTGMSDGWTDAAVGGKHSFKNVKALEVRAYAHASSACARDRGWIDAASVTRIAAKSDGRLTFGFLVGLGIALWSANAGMKAIFDALNIIYDEEEKRSLVRLNLVSLFFTICAIVGAGLAVALVVVFPLFLAAFGVTSSDHPIVAYLRWPVLFMLIILALGVLYRYG